MTIDTALLQEAKEARDRVIELEYEADRARLSYQHAIRKLHAAGGSLREIADALGISHQRVDQIVDGAEGKIALKNARNDIACSFCGLERTKAERIVAGPDVFVCDRCISLASEVVNRGEVKANERVTMAPGSDPNARCNFCGKKTQRLAQAAAVRICVDCLGLCHEILAKQRNQ